MGILDYLFRQAPGAIAGVKRGQREGQEIRRKQMFEDQDRARRDAMDKSQNERLLEEYQMRQADAPLIREERAARIADLKARALGTGSYADRPVAAPAPRNIDPNSAEGLTARKDFAKYEAGLRPRVAAQGGAAGQAAPKPGKILPASAVTGLSGTENVLNAAEAAQQAMKEANAKGLNVTGPITGRLTAITEGLGLANPEAVSVRGKLANITSEIMKQRSGGAITPQEFVRLEPFLASKNDTEEYAAQKITDLITYLESNRETALQSFEDTGYDVAKMRGRRAGDQPPPAPGGDDADAKAAAWLANRRKRP